MELTLHEIAQAVGGETRGDPQTCITGVAALEDAQPGDVAFADHAKFVEAAAKCGASALCVAPPLVDALVAAKPLLVVDRPRVAFAQIVALFRPQPQLPTGIHPTAVMENGVTLGDNVGLGAHAFVGRGAKLGNNVRVYPHVHVGADVVIGDGCLLYPHVTLYHRVTLGQRVVLHAGVVIGSDGFGYEPVGGGSVKVPQAGTVVIEDDVEIGANSTIDRATLSATIIGAGTKLDNMVHVAHNCKIGKQCFIAAQVGIAGSVTIADGVMIGGQAGFQPHARIGPGARIGGGAGVISDVPAGVTYSGYPAGPHQERMRMEAALKKLPELLKTIRRLEKEVASLKASSTD